MPHASPPTFVRLLTTVAPWAFALAFGATAHLALVVHELKGAHEPQQPLLAPRPWPDPAATPASAPATPAVETTALDASRVAALIDEPLDARIVPAHRDGELIGSKLFGIERGSVLRSLGFQNGDTLLRVGDNAAVADPAARIHEALVSDDRVDVLFERRGAQRLNRIVLVRSRATEPKCHSFRSPITLVPETVIVDRQLVDKLLANPALLAKQARIVPSFSDGEQRGFKLYGVRRGSLPRRLGLKNGDLLLAFNGHKLDSIEACMAAYEQLEAPATLELTYLRKHEQRLLRIQITEGPTERPEMAR